MAIGVVRLTKKARYTLSLAIVCFLIAQSLLGLFITSWSIYICASVSPTLFSEKSEVTFVFTVTGMYGTHVLFHNLTGIKICQKCYAQSYKKSTRRLLFFWTLAGCNTIINILILSMMFVRISKHIVRSMRHSMEKGMHNYLKDPYWKHTIDKLQIKMKCCGVTSYRDWHEFNWINEYHVQVGADLVKELRTSKDLLHLPVTPWSCCRIDFPMQCFHDPLQQIESAYLWNEQPSVVVESIYEQGCLVVLRQPTERAFVGFIIITVFILILQIITVLLTRILYTSSRNAVILENPDGTAPGWIFGRGDCGWARGPGLDELMEGIEPSYSASSSSKVGQQSSKSSGKVNFRLPKLRSENSKLSTPRSEEEPISSADEEALMLR